MKLEIVGENPLVSKRFLEDFLLFLESALKKKKTWPIEKKTKLVIAFVSSKKIQELNKTFLKKDCPTDILSFAPLEKQSFGELALCGEKILNQAKAHKLTVEEETSYLVLHGFLHLLGYQHEKGGPSAKKMYQIQDEIFSQWQENKRDWKK